MITDNLLAGRIELTYPETLPVICNMCQLPINTTPGPAWKVRDYAHTHEGRTYHFCSDPCRWCFTVEPARYAGHLSLVDRFLSGMIQPMDLSGGLAYMGLAPGEIGDDAHAYAWVEKVRAARERLAS